MCDFASCPSTPIADIECNSLNFASQASFEISGNFLCVNARVFPSPITALSQVGQKEVTWGITLTTNTCGQTINVVDTRPPGTICGLLPEIPFFPNPLIQNGLFPNGLVDTAIDALLNVADPVTPALAFVDVCSPLDLTYEITNVDIDDTSDPPQITRTWVATDPSGNKVSVAKAAACSDGCEQVVNVCQLSCPTTATVECGVPGGRNPGQTGIPTYENCGPEETKNLDFDDRGTGLFREGTITRHWQLEGLFGLGVDGEALVVWDECEQEIEVVDTTPPTFDRCPGPVTLECSANPEDFDPRSLGRPTVTDLCSPATLRVDFQDNVRNQETTGTYEINRRFRVRDDSGNGNNECVQKIIVQDTTAPIITCPDDPEGLQQQQCLEEESSPLPLYGFPHVQDACGSKVSVEYSDSKPTISGNTATTIRTFTATDEDSNASTCTQTIIIEQVVDNALEISCPADLTIPVIENCALPQAMIPDPEVRSAECSEVTFEKSVQDQGKEDLSPGEYTISVTATDASTNTATCTYTLTVVDDAPIDPTACACSGEGGADSVLEAEDKGTLFTFSCDPKPNGCPQELESVVATECISCKPIGEDGGSPKKSGKGKGACQGDVCGIDLSGGDDNQFIVDDFGPAGTFISVFGRVVDDAENADLAECTLCVSQSAGTGKSRRARELRASTRFLAAYALTILCGHRDTALTASPSIGPGGDLEIYGAVDYKSVAYAREESS
eukprot:scaffold4097_cov166-Amphora_coffeaeformis.AAC.39